MDVRGIIQSDALGQADPSNGFALGPTEGEPLIHFRDHGNIFVKISTDGLAVGTLQVMHG